MLISLSNLSILLKNGQFSFFSLFGGQFCYHSNGKRLSNLRFLHFGYCSNKSILLKNVFFYILASEWGGGGGKKPLNARSSLTSIDPLSSETNVFSIQK